VVTAVQKLIAGALADHESDRLPISISVASIEALGIDAETVLAAAARLNLPVLPNFDRQGSVLVARSPEILQVAERLRDQRQRIPVIPIQKAQQVAKPEPRTGSRVVQPLPRSVEKARAEKARKTLRAARAARGHPNYAEGDQGIYS
jgi:hypothetical protein